MKSKPTLTVVVFRSAKDRKYYFRIVARNHKIVAQSEGYNRLQSCERTVWLLMVSLSHAEMTYKGLAGRR